MKIYLIRHGETDWNHLNRFQGREDIPLNEAGIAQAAACGNALCHTGITAIYTSPLQRAFRTGEEIGRQTGLGAESVRPMEELIERDLGPFSGKCVENKQEYFALAAREDVPGMEPFSHVLERMQEALVLLARTGCEEVAAVSHGAAINVLLAGLSNHALGTGKTKLHNGGISVICGNESEGFRLEQCNLTPQEFCKSRKGLF